MSVSQVHFTSLALKYDTIAQPCEMSWQPYVDQLTGNKLAQYAAVCGKDGVVWAASPGLNITKDQILKLVAGFNPDNYDIKTQGITVEIVYSRRFILIKNDERSIMGSSGPSIFYAAPTNKAIIIAISGESVTPGTCTTGVDNMADYLIENGF